MSYRKVNDNSLASVADAIRSKGGPSDALVFPDGFVSAISAIQTGGGGEVSSGYSVTFPATANNWNRVRNYATLVLSDGSTINFEDYSVVAGRTINNVIDIRASAGNNNVLRLTLTAGAIVMVRIVGGGTSLLVNRIEAPESTPVPYAAQSFYLSYMLVEDTIISAIDVIDVSD